MRPSILFAILNATAVSATELPAGLDRAALDAMWNGSDAESGVRLAGALGGTLVDSGRKVGKQVAVSIQADNDECFFFPATLISGGEAQGLRFEAPGGSVEDLVVAVGRNLKGFCALRPGKISVVWSYDGPSTQDGLRYAILKVARDEFPRKLLPFVHVRAGDWCDPERWVGLFTRPVPGTLVFWKDEPFVVEGIHDGGEGLKLVAMNGAGNGIGPLAKLAATTDTIPAQVRFPKDLRWEGCPNNNTMGPAEAPLSRQIQACRDSVRKRHEAEVKPLNRRAYEKDMEKSCGPLRKKAEAEFRAAVDRIADAFVQKKVGPMISRRVQKSP